MQKRYLIVTQLLGEKKFHYPLPLAPVDTSDVRLLDKETMKFVIKNMGQTLKNNEIETRSVYSFFSAENPKHPQVSENRKLQHKLTMLK